MGDGGLCNPNPFETTPVHRSNWSRQGELPLGRRIHSGLPRAGVPERSPEGCRFAVGAGSQ
jgi:hypothetical protein